MVLTRDFKETIQERALRDEKFRNALLTEAVQCMLSNDMDTGKAVLRDYINATIGFEELFYGQIAQKPDAYARR